MGIQRLEIQGFRSLKNVTWEPGRLNLLVGPNGGGKSNVLRALEMISAAANGGLQKWIADQDGIIPLLWDFRSRTCHLSAQLDPVDANRDPIRDAVTFELELTRVGNQSAYTITRDSLGNWVAFKEGTAQSPYWIYIRDEKRAQLFDQRLRKLVDLEADSPENLGGFDPNESLICQIRDIENRIPTYAKRTLANWGIHQEIQTRRSAQMRRPMPTQVAWRLHAEGANLTSVLHTAYEKNRAFRQAIDEGMIAGFGDQYKKLSFPPAASGLTDLAVEWSSSTEPHPARDLSDGTLRFLFLLTALANPEPPDLIAIDEPDVGLHPSMLPIIAEYAAEAAQRTQVVLTTHSPEFLNAFTHLEPHVTVCHWQEGETFLFPLAASALEPWLKRYQLGELFTGGELELLTLPRVDELPDLDERLKAQGLAASEE